MQTAITLCPFLLVNNGGQSGQSRRFQTSPARMLLTIRAYRFGRRHAANQSTKHHNGSISI